MNNSLAVLGQLRRGLFVEDLDRELAALVDAVRDTGRKGSITIKLDIGMASKGDDMRITAVLDDHGAQPGHGRHRAVYPCPVTTEWAAWRKVLHGGGALSLVPQSPCARGCVHDREECRRHGCRWYREVYGRGCD